MEEKNLLAEEGIAELRVKRVRAQQNFVTALCVACMIFAAAWTIFAGIKAGDVRRAQNNKPDVPKSNVAVEKPEESEADTESAPEESLPEEEQDTNIYDNEGDELQDAAFIGDSRTVGLMNSTDKPQATFLCAVGLNIDTVQTSHDIPLGDGTTGTLAQALEKKSYGRVYISFGTNEMGWPYVDSFKEHFAPLIELVKEKQPDAQIWLIGILPVTRSQDAKGESVNNANAQLFTNAIRELAEEEDVMFLDCSPAVSDEYGYLPEEASTDGIHMNQEYCLKWQDFIIANS